MEWDVREIALRSISPNLRAVYAAESVDDISRSIRYKGQLEPVKLWFAGGSFRLLDGEKRWRACKKLGMQSIKAVIAEGELLDGTGGV